MTAHPLKRALRSTAAKTLIGIVTIGTASIGFVSDILGLRDSKESEPTVITVLVESESDTENDATTDEINAGTYAQSPLSTTTSVGSFSQDPETALDLLRTVLAARASSGVLDVCGKQAVLLTATGLRLFKWIDGTSWSDFSELVMPPTDLLPVGMFVVDVPRDGIPDLLVTFERTGTDSPPSGVLAVPSTSIGCGQGYSWQYFSLPDGSFSRLVPGLEPSSSEFISRGTVSGIKTVRYQWSQEKQYFQFQSDSVANPGGEGSPVSEEVIRTFMTEYGKFTTSSFETMLQYVRPNSPAEQLVKFLLSGKRASRGAGYGEGSGFTVEPVGEDWRILFPGSATEYSNFVGENDKISTFRMNEIELENLIRYDDSNPVLSRQCTSSGACIGIRGVQLGNRTTYVALEIDTSAMIGRAKFGTSWLTTGANRQRHLSSTNAIVNSPNVSTWSIAYELAELPWGATLEVQVSVNGMTERVTLTVP
jgi:hypothetical protein